MFSACDPARKRGSSRRSTPMPFKARWRVRNALHRHWGAADPCSPSRRCERLLRPRRQCFSDQKSVPTVYRLRRHYHDGGGRSKGLGPGAAGRLHCRLRLVPADSPHGRTPYPTSRGMAATDKPTSTDATAKTCEQPRSRPFGSPATAIRSSSVCLASAPSARGRRSTAPIAPS